MKKEHLETLLGVAELYESEAKKELQDAIEDEDCFDYEELEEEVKKWTEIVAELREEAGE